MIAVTHLYKQRVALFGLGNSGIATASALIVGGCDVVAWDDDRLAVEKACNQGFETSDLRYIAWDKIASLVISPGISLTHPQPHWVVRKAKSHNIEIIGDIELFVRERNFFLKNHKLKESECPIIAVTGTNGKSTTVTLISHLLTNAGCKVELGGNIGTAVLRLAPFAVGKFYIIECSSYQIDLAPSLVSNVAILLNITLDHIDRHGSFSRYAAIKKKLLSTAKVAILNGDDACCANMISTLIFSKTNTVIPFSSEKNFYNYFKIDKFERCYFYKDNALFSYIIHENREKFLVLLPQGVLRGRHSIHNTLAAISCCETFGFPFTNLVESLHSFRGLPHRMEEIMCYKNVIFINDSKATNAEATSAALSTFDQIHWIVGGIAKKGGITSLHRFFPKIKKAFLIGDSAETFATVLNGKVPFLIANTLENAVQHAAQAALTNKEQKEAVVLLSPACASFDQFANYAVRGDMFRQLVYNLKLSSREREQEI